MSSFTRALWLNTAGRAEAARINAIPLAERTTQEQAIVETAWSAPTARELSTVAATPSVSLRAGL